MVEEHPDIVVVNANYRLGPFGFIDFSGVEGGDPDNVTIFGESADEYNFFIYDVPDPSPEKEGHVLSEKTKNTFSE